MEPAPLEPTTQFAELERIDVRVGTIQSVEEVAGSKKLVRLRVGFGDHRRTILFTPEGARTPAGSGP